MKTFKKLTLTALLLATSTVAGAQSASDLQQMLPSNWGGWQNLTYGITDVEKQDSYLFPMQVATSGRTIHLAWVEKGKDADGLYRYYYRRSTDLGRTWEQAKVIGTSHEELPESPYYNPTFMAVGGNNVHFIIFDNNGYDNNHVYYVRSTDGGSTFETREIAAGAAYYGYIRHHIACDGNTVAMTFMYFTGAEQFTFKTGEDYRAVRVFSSLDGGATLKETKVHKQSIVDLKVDGNRWALLGDSVGKMLVTTSVDGGNTIVTKNIAHVAADGNSYTELWTPFSYSHLSMDGDNINVIYRGSLSDGNEGDPIPTEDLMHSIFQRSTDGGMTWQEPKYLEGTCGVEPNLIASRGDNIYVLTCVGTGNDGRAGRDATPTIFYSNDGGQTWATQPRAMSVHAAAIGSFTIAPDDPTGKHVFYTAEEGFLMESKDGFATVCRNFRIDDNSWHNVNWNNHTLRLLFDEEGTEHWFMQYAPSNAERGHGDHPWNICHRIAARPEATGGTNMAFQLVKDASLSENNDSHNIYIPMSPSIEATAEAMTAEMWVFFAEECGSFQLTCLSNESPNMTGNSWNNGWFIDMCYQEGGATPGGMCFEAGLHTVGDGDNNGRTFFTPWRYLIRETGQWHHVALTYDSKKSENNACLYIDGMLYGTATAQGKVVMGNNPLVIGASSNTFSGSVLIDNYALYSRALSAEEIQNHLYAVPDATDSDCRLLLTFDGSLRDQSQYQNDPAPLLANNLVVHDGIRPAHPDFSLTTDETGSKVTVTNTTEDGAFYWWLIPNESDPTYYSENYTDEQLNVDYTGYTGKYTFWMVAKGDGINTNAFAATSRTINTDPAGISQTKADRTVTTRYTLGGQRLNQYGKNGGVIIEKTTDGKARMVILK